MPIPRYAATNTVAMYSLIFPRLPRPEVAGVFIKRSKDTVYAMPALVRDLWRATRKAIPPDVLGDANAEDNTNKLVVEPDGTVIIAFDEVAWSRLTFAVPFVNIEADTPELTAAAQAAEEARVNRNPMLPSLLKQAATLVSSTAEWVANGAPMASSELYDARLKICTTCPSYDPDGFGPGLGRCRECGCGGAKLHMETSTCPLKKW